MGHGKRGTLPSSVTVTEQECCYPMRPFFGSARGPDQYRCPCTEVSPANARVRPAEDGLPTEKPLTTQSSTCSVPTDVEKTMPLPVLPWLITVSPICTQVWLRILRKLSI